MMPAWCFFDATCWFGAWTNCTIRRNWLPVAAESNRPAASSLKVMPDDAEGRLGVGPRAAPPPQATAAIPQSAATAHRGRRRPRRGQLAPLAATGVVLSDTVVSPKSPSVRVVALGRTRSCSTPGADVCHAGDSGAVHARADRLGFGSLAPKPRWLAEPVWGSWRLGCPGFDGVRFLDSCCRVSTSPLANRSDSRKRASVLGRLMTKNENLSNPLRDALGHWRPCLKGGRYLVHAHDIP